MLMTLLEYGMWMKLGAFSIPIWQSSCTGWNKRCLPSCHRHKRADNFPVCKFCWRGYVIPPMHIHVFQARDFGITHLRMVWMELTLLANHSILELHTTNSTCHFTCRRSLNPHRYQNYAWRIFSCLLPACAFIRHHITLDVGIFRPLKQA